MYYFTIGLSYFMYFCRLRQRINLRLTILLEMIVFIASMALLPIRRTGVSTALVWETSPATVTFFGFASLLVLRLV